MTDSASERVDGELTVVLADDHVVVRRGLRLLLEATGDLRVLAEAGDVDEAMMKTRALRPDVLVLDLGMGGRSSLPHVGAFREGAPETAIVILTMEPDPAFAREALRAGAKGYVLKDAAGEEVVAAVRATGRGGTHLAPSLGARLVLEPEDPQLAQELTEREIEVLRLLALGHTNAEIADELHLSRRTVESHRIRIQRKTGRPTRAGLVRYALDHGVLDRDRH